VIEARAGVKDADRKSLPHYSNAERNTAGAHKPHQHTSVVAPCMTTLLDILEEDAAINPLFF
jgi:hypothetical protein